ncbi:hypothetical protein RRG08_056331 [Elysia crispata]|uniref:Uncharacterized protein n=1 Tax=Elysia crispata TaxID=231223 RepID=A0AAE1D2B9_9GAST|nr:hypothetical protein RRG08_056331 [Elysia crispata]
MNVTVLLMGRQTCEEDPLQIYLFRMSKCGSCPDTDRSIQSDQVPAGQEYFYRVYESHATFILLISSWALQN